MSSRLTTSASDMRSRWVPITAAIVLAALAGMSSLGFSQKPIHAQTSEELPAGPMASKATTACLECHEARIILQQRLSKAAWTKEVDKMMKWGAVVDAADHDALIEYLSANFSPDQPQYNPPLTSPEKKSDSSAKKRSQ